jgi:DNA-binding transcriptional regulator YiaG
MTSVNSTSQYLQQELTNPEYSIVLRKTYPTKRKKIVQGYAGLREVVKLEKRSFAEKLTTSASLLSNF